MNLRRLLALACLLMPLSVQADIVVYGANSCETWTAERQKGDSGATWERPWLFGYLSGVARGADVDFMKGADPQKLLAWIDRFCQDNPKANLGQAAEVLAQALVRAMPPGEGSPQQGSSPQGSPGGSPQGTSPGSAPQGTTPGSAPAGGAGTPAPAK
ncbi:MAG TPA: hypothetical protein PKA20_01935 [Burkholderiaceae bacterium]|nr:hypothetical protein [Burkholderiaceae bacterium]